VTLPFSEADFLELFAAYNTLFWPAVVLLWIASVLVAARWLRNRAGRSVLVLLAIHWGWSGIAYHWAYFRSINPAAPAFAFMFVLQSGVLAWLASRGAVRFVVDRSPRSILGVALVVYGLLYPFISLSVGLQYPRVPLFALPCPSTLFTAGLLLTGVGLPRLAGIVPMAWAFIGGSAAVLLGIPTDVVLPLAGLLLLLDIVAPRALGSRRSTSAAARDEAIARV
jgi:hypothetical protein